MAGAEEDTVDYEDPEQFVRSFFAHDEAQLNLRIGAASHVGKVRERNEDHYAVVRNVRKREFLSTNLPGFGPALPDIITHDLAVTDGMGGAAGGELASRLALQTMLDYAGRATSWLMRIADPHHQDIRRRVEAYVHEIQRAFRTCVAVNPDLDGMGTTWTSAHVLGRHAIVVQIGDSRAYLLRGGELWLITRDQTLGQEMVDAGVPEDEARRFRNILTNNLGASSDEVSPQIYHVPLHPGDRLLLCTDGLSDLVSANDLLDVLQRKADVQTACDRLVEHALAAGGHDNITLIVCDTSSS